MPGHNHKSNPIRSTDGRHPKQTSHRNCFCLPLQGNHGMVGHHAYKWKGVFEYAQNRNSDGWLPAHRP